MNDKKICFIDSNDKTLFTIPDGGYIKVTLRNGEEIIRKCRYLDDYHTNIDGHTFHISEYAEIMERNGNTYAPARETEIRTAENIKFVKANRSEIDRDKFFIGENGVTEVYYNPDANAGGQLVYNEISFDLIREAARYNNATEFFTHLDSGCTQYNIDIDTPEFKGNLDSFMSRKADFENCNARAMRKLKEAAGIIPEKSHSDKNLER